MNIDIGADLYYRASIIDTKEISKRGKGKSLNQNRKRSARGWDQDNRNRKGSKIQFDR